MGDHETVCPTGNVLKKKGTRLKDGCRSGDMLAFDSSVLIADGGGRKQM